MKKKRNHFTKGNNINKFLGGCSDHRAQLFCLFELEKLPWPYGWSLGWKRFFRWGLITCRSQNRKNFDQNRKPQIKSEKTCTQLRSLMRIFFEDKLEKHRAASNSPESENPILFCRKQRVKQCRNRKPQ